MLAFDTLRRGPDYNWRFALLGYISNDTDRVKIATEQSARYKLR